MAQAPTRTLPLVDLSHTNAAVQHEVLADVAALMASGELTNGPHVARCIAERASAPESRAGSTRYGWR